MPGINKNLINMGDCFQIYYDMGQFRSLPELIKKLNITHPGKVPSYDTLKRWSRNDEWKLQIMMLDKEIKEGVREKMIPEWIETKVFLLKTLMDQVKKGNDDGVAPESTKDLVAASKEIRALMGEGDDSRDTRTKIQFEFIESNTEKEKYKSE